MAGKCPKCGADRNPGPECAKCGVIYAKAEQQEYQRKRGQTGQSKQPQGPIPIQTPLSLDCTACKTMSAMNSRKVWRFPLFIRFIGAIIAAPSIFGMLVGVILILHRGGFGLDGTPIIVGAVVLAASAVFGLVGWLLLMRKKAWVCSRCGYMLDRA